MNRHTQPTEENAAAPPAAGCGKGNAGQTANTGAPVACRVCHSRETAPLMDFGLQPNSMYLLERPGDPFQTHPLVLWRCAACGFVFIADPMHPDAFYTSVQHPTLTSPPPHLDELVRECAATLPATAHILDIGANTGHLLERLRDAGFTHLRGIEPSDTRLQAQAKGLDVEGGYFTEHWASTYAATHGFPSLVVCRHVLEHVENLRDFVSGLSILTARGATLLLETPDLQATAERGDCSVIWEQHVNYFDLATLRRLLAQHGLGITQARRIGFGGGALLCFAGRGETPTPAEAAPAEALSAPLADNLARSIDAIRTLVTTLHAQGRRIVGFGAGERGAMPINLAGLGDMLAYVVDDNPQKAGRHLSGSRLPIQPSAVLRQSPPDFCVLFPMNGKAVEAAIMQRFGDLTRQGMAFIELFPESGGAVAIHGARDTGEGRP